MAVSAARPTVSVYDHASPAASTASVALPDVFTVPIRPDVVSFIHSQISLNKRQAYAVKYEAGMDTAAESWGTGRAVSRIPRVPGGGTHRAGQGAFGNMCRGGRMFAPTKIWRRWHRKISINQRRYAVASALAASAVPALVMARGHKVAAVPELPLIVSSFSANSVSKTRDAAAALRSLGLGSDLDRVSESRAIRAGKGKARGRRYVQRKGPLVVHATNEKSLSKAFRNLPGVDVASVDSLSLVQLAPGGHLGRLIVWTQQAFEELAAVYKKKENSGFVLPKSVMMNADLGRLINSDEVQKVVRPSKDLFGESGKAKKVVKVNPLKNKTVMKRLNPFEEVERRRAVKQMKGLEDESVVKKREAEKKKADAEKAKAGNKKKRTEFYEKMM